MTSLSALSPLHSTMPTCKKLHRASASVLLITFFVNKSLCKTHYEKSTDHLYYQWNGGAESTQETESKPKVVDNNILNSVNDILNSFDDEHILNSMVEDIVKPVIKEAILREKENSKEYEIKDTYSEIFRKHEKVKDFKRRPEVYRSERYKYRHPARAPQLHRDWRPGPQAPVLVVGPGGSQYGQRLRRGLAVLASSAPVWQQFLQLVATGLLVFLLPGVFVG